MAPTMFSPPGVVRAHIDSMRDAKTGKLHAKDVALMAFVPPVAGAVVVVFDVDIGEAAAALLSATGLFTAFMFSLVVAVYSRATSWADSHPRPGPATSKYARRMAELSANAAYSALASASATTALIVFDLTSQTDVRRGLAGVAIALLAHLGLCVLMIVRRLYLLTQNRLDAARSGSETEEELSHSA